MNRKWRWSAIFNSQQKNYYDKHVVDCPKYPLHISIERSVDVDNSTQVKLDISGACLQDSMSYIHFSPADVIFDLGFVYNNDQVYYYALLKDSNNNITKPFV